MSVDLLPLDPCSLFGSAPVPIEFRSTFLHFLFYALWCLLIFSLFCGCRFASWRLCHYHRWSAPLRPLSSSSVVVVSFYPLLLFPVFSVSLCNSPSHFCVFVVDDIKFINLVVVS